MSFVKPIYLSTKEWKFKPGSHCRLGGWHLSLYRVGVYSKLDLGTKSCASEHSVSRVESQYSWILLLRAHIRPCVPPNTDLGTSSRERTSGGRGACSETLCLNRKTNKSVSVAVLKRISSCNVDVVLNEQNRLNKWSNLLLSSQKKSWWWGQYCKSIKLLLPSSFFGHLLRWPLRYLSLSIALVLGFLSD